MIRDRALELSAVALLLVAGAGVAVAVNGEGGDRTGDGAAAELRTTPVERRNLTETTSANGTLGYLGGETVVARQSGTVTWLPRGGQVISRGERLIEVDGLPALLFYGEVPAYRTLSEGMRGSDVRQLERNLAELGFDPAAEMTVDREFTAATSAAVIRWKRSLGLPPSGVVPLGRVVFLSGEQRVASLSVQLGATIGSGAETGDEPGGSEASPPATTVIETTSTRRGVSVDLPAEDQGIARPGASVRVGLPGGKSADGRVVRVSRVAGKAAEGGGATISVTIGLDGGAEAVSRLDEAPVSVSFTEVVRRKVLVVPVTALIAQPGGEYAVRGVTGGRARLLEVKPGYFSNGLVEISGRGIWPGLAVEDAG